VNALPADPPGAGSGDLGVLIVGGSLVGLSSALALARIGAHVTVLERSGPGAHEGGGGLGVDVALLRRVTGLDGAPPVCHGPDRDTTAWHLLRDWLEGAARNTASIHLVHDVDVRSVASDGAEATVTSVDGRRWTGDVVIGADGVHSTVRRFVDPRHPTASYAGFVLWRAMVSEAALPATTARPGPDEPSREFYAGRYRLVTYPVPGADGDDGVGHRRLNVVWYDPAREALLRAGGLLDGTVVRGSLKADDLPPEISDELHAVAAQMWPSPWADVLQVAFEQRLVFGTPVAEYLPRHLVGLRMALAGDAAHAASPMVGGGFAHGLYDAAQLADSVSSAPEVGPMLASYQGEQLGPARHHVIRSQRASRHYLDRRSTG
jgi:2-polyprenyl-6-methoxyphenol hydroxylase-like FAD-dependent oxidoreductase